MELVRVPGIAPGLPPWRGDILLLNYNREIKRAGSKHAPGPCHFNKEQTPLASLRYQPAVSRRLFRCLGAHLLRSPWNVNSGRTQLARFFATAGHHPLVEILGSPAPVLILRRLTSSRCRLRFVHRSFTFRLSLAVIQGKQKTLLTFGKQGLENIIVLLLPAHLRDIQIRFMGLPLIRLG